MIKKIKECIPDCTRKPYDTDKVISEDFDGSISNIFYQLGRGNALSEILSREKKIISDLTYLPDNLIIAAGPGVPFHENFKNYLSVKKPYVILLENSAENIYENLKKRRQDLQNRLEYPRPDFGIWDIGVMADENNIEYDKESAVTKIDFLLNQRGPTYRSFANFTFKTNEVLSDSRLPEEILNIL